MVFAIYGGAFGPPHVGHAMVTTWILWTGQADRVILAPAADHPFGKKMAPLQTRMDYCRALIKDIGGGSVGVSDVEASLPAPNYTINLLRWFQSKHPSDTIRCVMGADNLVARDRWYGFEDIVREFSPIFVNRAGVVLPPGVEVASPVFPEVSSTEVRRRVAEGLPIDHLVTKSVGNLLR